MENMSFEELLKLNCFSENEEEKNKAKELLEKYYCLEVNCIEIDKSVLFAHHGRGCTIIAAKIYENVVILQNVTIGTSMKYNKTINEWENIGNPIICKNVVIADGAKIFGPIIIGANSVVSAGAIVTKDIPENSIVYGVNQFKPKDSNYDYIYNSNMVSPEELIKINKQRIEELEKKECSCSGTNI